MVATAKLSAVERAAALAESFTGRAADYDRTGAFPFENFAALEEAGLIALTVSTEYGGEGAGLETACRVVEQIARGDASTALVLAMQLIYSAAITRNPAVPVGVREQIGREAVEHGALINVMRVEPELGTPSRGGLPRTTAVRTDNGWRLNGHKLYATGSPILRYFAVFARTEGDEPLTGMFLVPNDVPGLRIVETWDHLGMRATGSHDLLLENVEVPVDAAFMLRRPADAIPSSMMAWNALILTALYHGVACAARDWLVGYLHERVPANLGAPLASLPRFQTAVGEIAALLYTNDQLIYGLAAAIDAGAAGADVSPRASLTKYQATSNAIRAVDIALGLIGNPGLSRTHPLERHHRDVLCSRIHTPQDDTILINAGRAALGL